MAYQQYSVPSHVDPEEPRQPVWDCSDATKEIAIKNKVNNLNG